MAQLSHCRACNAPDPHVFLRLGDQPPANMFVPPEQAKETQPAFSLDLQACLHCGLIQVADQIPADFFRHYLYVPSGADTMHGHFAETARVIAGVADNGLVIDIGCNDGLLLAACNGLGCRTLGVDPAANIAPMAAERGVEVHLAYFGPETAAELRAARGPASVIVTTNTFNHIGDLDAFMTGVDTLLSDEGSFFVEVPMALELVRRNRFDNIYQEHVSEFSVGSMVALGARFGFAVVNVDRLKVHGGSMRVQFRRIAAGATIGPEVARLLEEEAAAGLLEADTYTAFAARIEGVRKQLLAMLDSLHAEGKAIAGYGAPAKGNTLLNSFGIGPDRLTYLVDRNPLKHGLLSPGMKIPVRSTDAITEDRPDILLVLAWNFFDEIRAQQSDFEAGGGRFLVPLPEPTLVP
jgi:hypothetical protein